MATETAAAIAQKFQIIPIGLIQESKTNPRKTFDAKGLDELAASIAEQGIVEPLILRPIEEKDAPYELVAGARRLRAARKAKLEEVPCLVRELTDDQALEIQVIENLQRRDLHPLEEAEGYKALLKRPQYHVDAIADKVGKSVSYVWQRIKLTELIDPAKKAFLEDQITAGHAVLIARLQPADQKEALSICNQNEWMEHGQSNKEGRFLLSVRDLSAWIKDNIHLSLDGAPWQKDDVTLVAAAGACDSCPKRAGNAPGLWPEITRAQTCTDRACFNKKLNAHLDREAKALKAEGKKIVKISDEYDPDDSEVLGNGRWRSIDGKKKCASSSTGFYIDGAKRGQTTEVCIDPGCRIHKPKGSYSPSHEHRDADQQKERAKEILKERATAMARLEILSEILQKAKTLDKADLDVVAAAMARRIYLGYDVSELKTMPKRLADADTQDFSEFNRASEADLAKFIIASALDEDTKFHRDGDLLYAMAKRHKIDFKAIEKRCLQAVVYDRAHKDRMQRWKGLKASGNTRFETMTCQLCGREEKEQSKGGWHWVKKNDKNKCATCNDCERLERK